MYSIHPTTGGEPTQLERSRIAAERYALVAALRAARRDRRRSSRHRLRRTSTRGHRPPASS
jgi:hypothetical protein